LSIIINFFCLGEEKSMTGLRFFKVDFVLIES